MILFPVEDSEAAFIVFLALGLIVLWMCKDAIIHLFVPRSHTSLSTDSRSPERDGAIEHNALDQLKLKATDSGYELLSALPKELGLSIEVGIKQAFMLCWKTSDRTQPHIFLASFASGQFVKAFFSICPTTSMRYTSLEFQASDKNATVSVSPTSFSLPREGALERAIYLEINESLISLFTGLNEEQEVLLQLGKGDSLRLSPSSVKDCIFMVALVIKIRENGAHSIAT